MKKLLIVLLTLALLLGALSVPALAESRLMSWNGFEIWATDYSYNEHTDGKTTLRMDVRVVNNTDHRILVLLNDVQIDGTEINGAGVSNDEPGSTNTDWMLFSPTEDNPTGGSGAISTGSQIDMTMRVVDHDSYEELYRQSVSVNLYDLSGSGGSTDYGDDTPADFGHGGASSASYAPAYTPASTDYKPLKKGSKGQAVRDLQQRLTDLGYLNDRVDGSFGRNTLTAVRSFCEQNDLRIGTEATPEMQALLYSSNARYWVEDVVPLKICSDFTMESPRETGLDNFGFINLQVVNRSSTRGIRGFTLVTYQTDMYNNKIEGIATSYIPGQELYYSEVPCAFYVEPGHYRDFVSCGVPKYYNTYSVFVGVWKVVLDDGEVRETPFNDIIFYECSIGRYN